MRIEAVTVCINYGDFLAVTAEWNRHLFDHWVVVTSPDDDVTREVCRQYQLQTLLTEEGYDSGGRFNKGALVERGLQMLSTEGWRWHLDADVVFPSHTRKQLELAHLDPAVIYGVDRIMVRSWNDWVRLRDSGYVSRPFDNPHEVRFPPGFEVGSRWVVPQSGWVPIGFTQLWHASMEEWRRVRVRPYPGNHGGASHTDVRHSLQWDRRRRQLLPELIAVHLESEHAEIGANWTGRTTAPFGPPPAR